MADGENCGSCRFFWLDREDDWVCRRHPPATTVMMVPDPDEPGRVVPRPFCTFPYVEPEYWCGEWQYGGNSRSTD